MLFWLNPAQNQNNNVITMIWIKHDDVEEAIGFKNKRK